MMKIKYILIALIGFLIACSDENVIERGEIDRDNSDGGVYLNFRILTTDNDFTRADNGFDESGDDTTVGGDYDNNGFDESGDDTTVGGGYDTGTADESAVKNGRIYIFEGATEAEAVCVAYGEIGEKNTTLENSGYLSVKNLECRNVKINAFESEFDFDDSATYYALVLLNVNNEAVYPEEGEKFTDWAKDPLENSMLLNKDGNTYITMSNATGMYSSTGSESFAPTTLAKIDNSDFSNKKNNNSEIKTMIFVQRNVAKLLVNARDVLNPGGYNAKKVEIGDFKVQVSLAGWRIEVANTKTYPVMNIDGINWEKKEFMKSGFLNTTSVGYYDRVFWAKDPNYGDETLTQSDFSNPNSSYEINKPGYCLENTMDYDCMLQGQTTRIVVTARWQFEYADEKLGTYISGNGSIPPECKFNSEGYDKGIFYKIDSKDYFWCQHHMEEEIKKIVENPTITWTKFEDGQGGYYNLREIVTVKIGDREISKALYDKIANSIGLSNSTAREMGVYENCRCYYVIRIPHFNGATQTPWDSQKEVTGRERDGEKIADYNESHLGRWGILRNVFYEVIVKEIHHLGSPMIPPITDDDTDDMPDQDWLSIEVKGLPWRYVHQGSFTLGE
ncbi:MAG: fimbria major subunit [Muribaculaceae bacterium]|nr:fimbria major subunit [Muribaculaceae bacterium]